MIHETLSSQSRDTYTIFVTWLQFSSFARHEKKMFFVTFVLIFCSQKWKRNKFLKNTPAARLSFISLTWISWAPQPCQEMGSSLVTVKQCGPECSESLACAQVPTVQSHRNESEERLRVPAKYLAVVHIFTCSVCFGGGPSKLDVNEQPPFFERSLMTYFLYVRNPFQRLASLAQWIMAKCGALFNMCFYKLFIASFWQEKMRMP